jgi:UDPglucose 6-dehydrogenase
VPDVEYCDDAYEVAVGSDALLLATEWHEYTNLIWPKMRSLMRRPIIVDGRNALDGNRLSGLVFTYLAFGRPTVGAAAKVSRYDDGTDETVLDAV